MQGYYATSEVDTGSFQGLQDILAKNSYKSKFIINCENKMIVNVESLFVVP